MATPVFCCGFECGVTGPHWTISGGESITTSSPLTGARSLLVNPTASSQSAVSVPIFSGGIHVFRFKVKWTTLPDVNVSIGIIGLGCGAYFNIADNKIYAGSGLGNIGATGVSVTTGVTYYIDVKSDSTANPWVVDVKVNGVACGQHTRALAANTSVQSLALGADSSSNTSSALFDDVIWSNTAADYPFGNGKVDCFTVTADGTHNVASADDFERTLTGTDITNATTTAFQLVDDVPLETSPGDFINMVAPPNATDYVECVFGPAPGVSTPTVAPRAVEVIAGIHQASTATGNMEIRLNDNGTTNAVYSASGVAGSTSIVFKRKHYATAPTGGAWTVVSGAGNFNNLKVRFGSPGSVDANPDQFFDSIMIEAEFETNVTVTPGAATLTLTTFAPQLHQTVTPPKRDLSLTTFAPTAQQGKTVTPPAVSLALTKFAPQLQQKLTPANRALALSTFAPKLQTQLTPTNQSLALTTFAPAIKKTVTPPSASLTLTRFAPQLQTKLTPTTRSLALTTFAPIARVNQIVTVGSRTLTLTTFAPRLVQTLTPSSRSVTLTTFAPQLQQKLTPGSRLLVLTAFAPLAGLGVVPGSGLVTLTTFAPNVTQSAAVVPGNATLTLTRFAPVLQETITPAQRTLTLTPFAPMLKAQLTPGSRALSFSTFAPSVSQNTILTPASISLTLTRFAPAIGRTVTPQNAVLSLSRFAPQLRQTITPASRSLVMTTFPPVLDNNVTVIPVTANLTFTRFAPSVLAPQTVTPQSRALTMQTFAPQLRAQLKPPPATLITTAFAPVIRNTVRPASRSLLLTTFAPRLQTYITITGGTLTLITFAPTVIGHELHALPDDVTLVRRTDNALRVRRSSATLTITSD